MSRSPSKISNSAPSASNSSPAWRRSAVLYESRRRDPLIPRTRIGLAPLYGRRAVAAAAELVDEPRVGGLPIELGACPRRVGALVQQKHLGEVVAQARPRLGVGAGDGSRRADRDGGRLGQLGDGRVRCVADQVVAAGRVVFE